MRPWALLVALLAEGNLTLGATAPAANGRYLQRRSGAEPHAGCLVIHLRARRAGTTGRARDPRAAYRTTFSGGLGLIPFAGGS